MSESELRGAIERLSRRVGERLRTMGPVRLDETAVRRFREAMGWPPDPALGVPPAMVAHVFRADVDVRHDVRPRETIDDALVDPVNGGTEIRFGAPLRIGEVLTGEVVLAEATVREGRSGPLALVVTETICRGHDGAERGRMRLTMIYRKTAR